MFPSQLFMKVSSFLLCNMVHKPMRNRTCISCVHTSNIRHLTIRNDRFMCRLRWKWDTFTHIVHIKQPHLLNLRCMGRNINFEISKKNVRNSECSLSGCLLCSSPPQEYKFNPQALKASKTALASL